jgi:hypothetical protein
MVRKIDADYLDELRANAEQIREDLAAREQAAETDHDAVMASVSLFTVNKLAPSSFVYKTKDDARVKQDILDIDGDSNGDEPPLFNDEQLDVLAQMIVDIRQDVRDMIDDAVAPLKERIASLEGSINMLMAMIGDTNRSFESSEVIRKLKVQR